MVRPSRELLAVVEEYFANGPSGAAAWRGRYVAPDAALRVIGTDDTEWLAGPDAYAVLADESAHVDTEVPVSLREVEAFESGDVGWVAARPEVSMPDGTSLSLRWSAVFEKSRGSWTLRQVHVSRG